MAEIVFVTLFLGLVSGVHPLEMHATPAVKSIRITLGEREIASLVQPPWRTKIDLGPELVPQELTAIGYDDNGKEIGRATQVLNLPRSFADLSILVKRENETPVAVEVIGRHLELAAPKSAKVILDGQPLPVVKFSARLPQLDWSKPHVVAARLQFVDGVVARREIVLTGGSYVASSELTPVLVSGKPASVDDCFSAGGTGIRASAVERPDALVAIVRDPDPSEANAGLKSAAMLAGSPLHQLMFRRDVALGTDAFERMVWPVSRQFAAGSDAPSALFEWSGDVKSDFMSLFSRWMEGTDWFDQPRYFADAVAVAGLQTIKDPRRRAVVLLLSHTADKSEHTPASVRHYLERIGVPLFVWSFSGPRPELADTWGEVVDISRRDKFHDAVVKLRETLAAQNIVWLPVDRLTALHVTTDPRCGVLTVATPGTR